MATAVCLMLKYVLAQLEPLRHPFPDPTEVSTGVIDIRIGVARVQIRIISSWDGTKVSHAHDLLPDMVDAMVCHDHHR